MNEDNIKVLHDACNAFNLYLFFFFRAIQSRNTVRLLETYVISQVLDFAIFAFLPNWKTKYTRNYERFVLAKFGTRDMQNIVYEKQVIGKILGILKENTCFFTFLNLLLRFLLSSAPWY